MLIFNIISKHFLEEFDEVEDTISVIITLMTKFAKEKQPVQQMMQGKLDSYMKNNQTTS